MTTLNKPRAIGLLLLMAIQICEADLVYPDSINLTEQIYLDLVPGVTMKRESPVDDFMLVDFTKDGESLMKGYIGNAPNFPGESELISVSRRKINGLLSEEILYEHGDLYMEVLINVDANDGWPRFIHFALPAIEKHRSIAIQIINSIHLQPNL